MTIEKRLFGHTKHGCEVDCYRLENGGIAVEVLTYGGTIRSLTVPAPGGARDVVLGFDDMAGYEAQEGYIGATIGRVGNRIGGAHFILKGTSYAVDANDGPNCLHGGFRGFDKQVWEARLETDALALSLLSPDMDCGFPGNLNVEVRYSLISDALSIGYTAECDADTPVSLTNHCYFNLGGHGSGSIGAHTIQILAEAITQVDGMLIPTGELLDIADTPFDLSKPTIIGSGLSDSHPQIAAGNGYDHNFVLSHTPRRSLMPVAVLYYSGLTMACLTTQPGLQFYSGNHLSGASGKGGSIYSKHSGLCLETQAWPDAVNHPGFPDCVLKKGETYRHKTMYAFKQD